MHAIEKILAKAAGKDSVATGEIVNCLVDLGEVNDIYLQTVRSFYEMGGKKVHDPKKLVFIMDHYAPASTILQADNQKQFREFCRDQNIELFFDVDQGVCHQAMVDNGLVYPGMILVATDSHTTTHGAFGAFGTGVGANDMAVIMITGKLWFRVPEIIRFHLTGTLSRGVFAKDVILKIIGDLGADYGIYKGIDFTGPVLKDLNVSERMALCNMTTEMGAKTAYIQPDEITLDFVRTRVKHDFQVSSTDPGYKYAAEHTYDISRLKPQLARAHHSVDNVHPSDTVGAVALDRHNRLAAATSTGETQDRAGGRVGDSPVIGAGTYADDRAGAASSTGWGEGILRVVLAKTAVDRMARGESPYEAGRSALATLRRVHGKAGLILVDRRGRAAAVFNTPRMARGVATETSGLGVAVERTARRR